MSFADMFHQLHWNMKAMLETIQRLIDEKGSLSIAARNLPRDGDLHRAGLTPFSAIQVMLALEKEFNIEFPKWMLNRQSMSSIDAIVSRLCELQEQQRKMPARAA
jgi:acyl carrier protein